MALQIALSYEDGKALKQMTERIGGISSRDESLMERAFVLAKLMYLPDVSVTPLKGDE